MGNAASSRPGLFRRTRLVAISAVVGILAISAVVATLVLMPALSRPVHASGVGGGCLPTSGHVCTFKGQTGFATFQSTTSCTVTNIFVFVNANFEHSGATTTQTFAILNLSTQVYNSCTLSFSDGNGQDFNPTVQFTSNVLTAQGSVDVQTYNPDGTVSTTTYTVDLTWKGFGRSSRQVESTHFQSASFITQSHFTGTSRSALVTGTLSDGTTNFAASAPTFGESLGADSGTFVIIQK